MFDQSKHIGYWIENAKSDFQTAELLIKENKILHGLFFCHLTIEKALKAHVVKVTHDVPPRSHNLLFLSEIALIEFPDKFIDLPGILMHYQLEGRYPDFYPNTPLLNEAFQILNNTQSLFLWLQEKL